MKQSIFFIAALFLPCLSFAQIETPDYHDIHMHAEEHWDFSKKEIVIDLPPLVAPHLLGGMVISPTYSGKYQGPPLMRATGLENLSIARTIGKQLMETRHRLLCGISATVPSELSFLKECLAIPGAIGAKMRGVSLRASGRKRNRERQVQYSVFKRTLKALNAKKSILLVHFSYDLADQKDCDFDSQEDCLYGTPRDVSLLIELLRQYPLVRLVIAHSGLSSFVGLNGLSQIARSDVSDRVYIDTAAAFGNGTSVISWIKAFDPYEEFQDQPKVNRARANKIIASWKEFGTTRIIYGTDIGPRSARKETVEVGVHAHLINTSTLLTNEDKASIFRDNYESLLHELELQ